MIAIFVPCTSIAVAQPSTAHRARAKRGFRRDHCDGDEVSMIIVIEM